MRNGLLSFPQNPSGLFYHQFSICFSGKETTEVESQDQGPKYWWRLAHSVPQHKWWLYDVVGTQLNMVRNSEEQSQAVFHREFIV